MATMTKGPHEHLTDEAPPEFPAGIGVTREQYLGILGKVKEGIPLDLACRTLAVKEADFERWEAKFSAWGKRLRQVEAEGEEELLGIVRGGKQGWQSAAWQLERRWPGRWGQGRRKMVEVKGNAYSQYMARRRPKS